MKGNVKRNWIRNSKRWVVKIGSSLLTHPIQGLDEIAIAGFAQQIADIKKSEIDLVLVTSGAVVAGMQCLGLNERPDSISGLQAAASIGQVRLIQAYERAFAKHGYLAAQILLTHSDTSDRLRYLNVRSTLRELVRFKVIPIINENDTIATADTEFGENDTLGGLVCNIIDAEIYVILTNQQGLYDGDPNSVSNPKLITNAIAGDVALESMAGASSNFGRGGMLTKVKAAEKAAAAGATTIIASGMHPKILNALFAGEELGTMIRPQKARMRAKKQWLAGLRIHGTLQLDDGAAKMLSAKGRSLLPIGVRKVSGQFTRGEMVQCVDQNGNEIARGLANYPVAEAEKIIGRHSSEIAEILGYVSDPELIHRDNMVLK